MIVSTLRSRLVPTVLAVALVACGKKPAPPATEGKELSKNPLAAGAQLEGAARKAAEAAKELEAMAPVDPVPYPKLVELLPQAPSGWKAQEARGDSTQGAGFKVSRAERDYESGEKRLEATIVDGAFNAPIYVGVTMAAQFAHESTDGFEKGVTIDGDPGVEKFVKDGARSELVVVVGKRYLVTLRGNGVDTAFLRSVFSSLDRKALAGLR